MNSLSRRILLAQFAGVSAQLLSGCTLSAMRFGDSRSPIGIQLWTVNAPMVSDPAGTLGKLRQMGYEEVEAAGFGKLSAKGLRRLLEDADLRCPSAHLDFLNGDPEALFEDAHALGVQYATSSLLRWGSGAALFPDAAAGSMLTKMRAMTMDDARQTAALANRIGEKARQAGLRYTYHNHAFEFIDQGGAIGYDILLQETDPDLVAFEIDCGWMKVAGYNPLHYFRKYPNRFPMIHVKDFVPIDAQASTVSSVANRAGIELGHGFVDYRPILAAGKSAGVKHYFAEQEGPFTRMSQLEAAQVSYDYLRSLD